MSRHDHGRRVGAWVIGYVIVGSIGLLAAGLIFLVFFGGLSDLRP